MTQLPRPLAQNFRRCGYRGTRGVSFVFIQFTLFDLRLLPISAGKISREEAQEGKGGA